MKSKFALFFTLLYITAMIKPAFPVIEFYLNQDFIAEFLCINKNKPKLQCNGKCQLSKMMEAETENESVPNIDLREYPLAIIKHSISDTPKKVFIKKTFLSFYKINYKYQFNFSFLRPPKLLGYKIC